MSVVLDLFIVLAAIAALAMTVLVLIAEWRGFRTEFRRIPPGQRGRAVLGGGGAVLYTVVAAGLLIASPWGKATWLVFFGGVAVVLLAVTAVLAVTGARKH